jgi:hypothetical protein
MTGKRRRLEQFLQQRDIRLHSRERFIRRTSRKNPLVSVDYSIFLDENQRFKKYLFPLVKEIIRDHDLKIFFVMVSWWGRGDQALWTGSHLLETLREFEKKGYCEIFLSYQEGPLEPSSLCSWCQRRKIETFLVDRFQLVSRMSKKIVVPHRIPGKAENVIKSIKLIEKRAQQMGTSPKKILVIFVDDDYTQYHWLNYFLLFAPWVLSFAGKTKDKTIDQIIAKIKNVSFIKSGSPRIILPYELQGKIVRGQVKPPDYLGVTNAILDLASAHRRYGEDNEKEELTELAAHLQKIKRKGQVYSPKRKADFFGERLNARLESLWREYIYRGGRVTQRLEGILRHLIHKSHCRWLRQFTFLLHGDQGAPLDSWLEFSPFSGYALEVSLLMQAVCDKAFEHHQVLNIAGLPHSHQRSKDLAIWQMLDNILLAFDLLRVLYKDLSVRDFLSIYGIQRHIPMLDRFGDIIEHRPEYKGLQVYPPPKTLAVEEVSSGSG